MFINTVKLRRIIIPRLSLYRPERGNDYEFIDRRISEQFTIGGTDVLVHKYIGAESASADDVTPEQPIYDALKPTNIQDLLFLENRDRKYDPDIYKLRGIYNIQDIDFNLSQFGLFLSNDVLFLTVHIRDSVKTIGRKIISGDVIELPHLRDEYALNDLGFALKRFYVVEDVNRAAEGFSQTWYPHLYRLKLKQIYDGQEYKDIMDLPASDDTDTTLRDLMSTYDLEIQINNAVVHKAEMDALKSGYDVTHFYTIATNDDGSVNITTIDTSKITAGDTGKIADTLMGRPLRTGYIGYLLGVESAPNGAPYGVGTSFPLNNDRDDYYLRTDFLPNRLFVYDGVKWTKTQDNVRMTLSNTDDRLTQKGTFINNTATNVIGGTVIEERQSLSKALRPRADNT